MQREVQSHRVDKNRTTPTYGICLLHNSRRTFHFNSRRTPRVPSNLEVLRSSANPLVNLNNNNKKFTSVIVSNLKNYPEHTHRICTNSSYSLYSKRIAERERSSFLPIVNEWREKLISFFNTQNTVEHQLA